MEIKKAQMVNGGKKEKKMNKTIILCILIVAGFIFSGCETARGAGKDMENAGKGIQRTVDKND